MEGASVFITVQRVYYPLLCIVGIPGNLFTFYMICFRECGMSHTAIVYLSCLAIVDTFYLVWVILLDLTLTFWQSQPFWHSHPACAIMGFLQYGSLNSSSWIVVVFTIERYLVLSGTLTMQRFPRAKVTRLTCVSVVLVSHLASVPMGWINVVTSKNVTVDGLNVSLPRCHYRDHLYSTVLVWVTTFLSGGIPIVLVIVFNSLSGINLIRAGRLFTKEDRRVVRGGSAKVTVRRTILLLGTVSVTFVLLSIPRFVTYCILRTKYNHEGFDRNDYHLPINVVGDLANMLQNLNSTTNFLLYCVVSRRFRQEVLNTLACKTKIRELGSVLSQTTMKSWLQAALHDCFYKEPNAGPGRRMDNFQDSRHKSIPVETDESMTFSTPDLPWPSGGGVKNSWFDSEASVNGIGQVDYPRNPWRCPTEDPVDQLPPNPRSSGLPGSLHEDLGLNTWKAYGVHSPPSGPQHLECSLEGAEHLETPLPLRSDTHHVQQFKQPAVFDAGLIGPDPKLCGCHRPQPIDQPHPFNHNHPRYNHVASTSHRPYGQEAPYLNRPQYAQLPREVMSEVHVGPFHPAPLNRPGGVGTPPQEIRRTVSLPEECKNVFITYSVDVASEIFTFVKFLTDQGFKPAIDIFNSAVQSLDINKWMDSYLNNKSVLIIVVISPKYKADVEGDGEDEHGLHTKYIHTQIQNEFIQQRCLNFRLVPVLFPIATKRHVPAWLQNTKIFRWPQDTQDLLLRLLREERYIPPPLGKELTISMRPI
ncbi:hypothetical protein DPEC_G00083810 [Dallia pectoralis]|uniref:Uncharacterized protein n=1 Tax=Dallia pectoralis TaxID=75939 RepID=A0ACC2GZ47_DALPE|nr:hypothetical protein DPEC_G00083810 [Dallia pectoralis]